LQAMPPSGLRLQLVRSLAQMTQTTPAEIEALFELTQPVARVRIAPPRGTRPPPLGLERKIMRLLVAHPVLASDLDLTALDAVAHIAPDNATMLTQLAFACQELGLNGTFATLSEQLRGIESDFEPLITEIAAESESDIDACRLELAGAVRQAKMKLLKTEIDRLAATGLQTEEAQSRYRELVQQQEQLRRQAEVENVPR